MSFEARDHVPVSDATRSSYARTAHDHLGTSDSAARGSSYARTAHDHLGTSDSATAKVLIQVPAARVIARAAGPTVTITRSQDLSVPRIDVGLAKNQWDFTTITTGITVGALVGHLPGAIVGGVALWSWGQWRWRNTNKS
jgi:hypothetical protein